MNEVLCIGSVLNADMILTTSSCVGKFQGQLQSFLLAIDANKQFHSIEKIILHESYNNVDSENDVALVRLSIPLRFTNRLKPIPLSTELQPNELRAFEWKTKKNIVFITNHKYLPEILLPNKSEENVPEPQRPQRRGRIIDQNVQVNINETTDN